MIVPASSPPSPDHPFVEPALSISTEAKSGRNRILDHARTLFLERGFLDVSMREIAEAAGMRKASLYHHFRDKEELFTAVIVSETAHLRDQMAASIEGVTGFRARLERLTSAHLHATRTYSVRLSEDFRTYIPESHHEEMHAELRSLFAIYDQVFRDAAAAGEISAIEPSLAASCFFQIVLSLGWDWLETGGPVKPEADELARLAVQMILFGIAGGSLRP